MILVHTVARLIDVGYSNMFAATVYAVTGGIALVSPIGGMISDRIGREPAYTMLVALMGLGVIVLMLTGDASTIWMPYLFAVLYGVGNGGERPVIMAAQADVFKGKHVGGIMGFSNLGFGVGGALGSWLGGYVFDMTGNYIIAFAASIPFLISAVVFFWLAAPRKVRIAGVMVQEPLSIATSQHV